MSGSIVFDVLVTVFVLSATVAYAYAAYWGFAIARRFVVRAYRYQALGIASIGVYFGVVNVVGTFVPVSPTSSDLVLVLVGLLNLAGVPLILLWVDSTARVARRSDPFDKDSLGWTKLRYVVFAAESGHWSAFNNICTCRARNGHLHPNSFSSAKHHWHLPLPSHHCDRCGSALLGGAQIP